MVIPIDTINWDAVAPGGQTLTQAPEGSVEVPAEVIARFKSTRGLGRSVFSKSNGRFRVRTINGTVFAVPASAVEGK